MKCIFILIVVNCYCDVFNGGINVISNMERLSEYISMNGLKWLNYPDNQQTIAVSGSQSLRDESNQDHSYHKVKLSVIISYYH